MHYYSQALSPGRARAPYAHPWGIFDEGQGCCCGRGRHHCSNVHRRRHPRRGWARTRIGAACGRGGPDATSARSATGQSRSPGDRARLARDDRSRGAPRQRRHVQLLDVQRDRARAVRPGPGRRHRQHQAQERKIERELPLAELPRRQRPRRRRIDPGAAGRRAGIPVEGDASRPLRLSLHDSARPDPHRQRDVRAHPRRARGWSAEGGSRVLRDAGGVLYSGPHPGSRPSGLRHGEGARRASRVRRVQRQHGLAAERRCAGRQGRRDGAPLPRQRRPVARLVLSRGGRGL